MSTEPLLALLFFYTQTKRLLYLSRTWTMPNSQPGGLYIPKIRSVAKYRLGTFEDPLNCLS
jgi:hypothetical protein